MSTATARQPLVEARESASSRPIGDDGFEIEALQHREALKGFALRLVRGNVAAAEYLVQDSMIRAFRSWHRFKHGTNCRAWLMKIVRKTFIQEYRREVWRRTRLGAAALRLRANMTAAAACRDNPEVSFLSRLRQQEIVDAIDDLPLHHREVVAMSDLQGLSYSEIAEVVGVPPVTVKSRLLRGRQALQERLSGFAVERGQSRVAVA